MDFKDKIKELRINKGITQQQASDDMGFAVSSLRNYENGRFPDTFQLKKIKEYYNVSYEYLLDEYCINKNNENINISNILKLTDKSITEIKELNSFIECNDNFTKSNAFSYLLNNFIESGYSIRLLDLAYKIKQSTAITRIISFLMSLKSFQSYIIKALDTENIEEIKKSNEILNTYKEKLLSLDSQLNNLAISNSIINCDKFDDLTASFFIIIKSFDNKDKENLKKELKNYYNHAYAIFEELSIHINYNKYVFSQSISKLLNELSPEVPPPEFLYFSELEKYYIYMDNYNKPSESDIKKSKELINKYKDISVIDTRHLFY